MTARTDPVSEPYVCPMIERYCKRGHLRTKESTFERKVRVNGKDYIVRDCRVCHAIRNTDPSPHKRASKWKRYVERTEGQ